MTREEAKQFIPIIQAYSEGKTIEHDSRGAWNGTPGGIFSFDLPPERYRIKPEPKLRPWHEHEVKLMLPIRLKKNHKHRGVICAVDGIKVYGPLLHGITLEQLMENYEQIDGSPCGVIE